MQIAFMDLETFSPTPISYGSHRYAEKAEVLLWGYAVGDAPAKVWDKASGAPMPEDLRAALDAARRRECLLVWHNGMMFDTVVLERLGLIDGVPLEAEWDTMVQAYQHGLPGALGDLCPVLGLTEEQSKRRDGARLVQKFCKPAPQSHKVDRYTQANSPEDWARFVDYCRMDVESMRTIFNRLPRFNCNKTERRLQMADAVINRRGIKIDIELAEAALKFDSDHKSELRRKTSHKTRGEVTAATQRDKLMAFIEKEYGWKFDDFTKDQIERRIDDPEVPEPVKELLRLRLSSAATSATKYRKVLNAASVRDGRLRGCLQFRGAMRTGRWSGRIFQPQNLARPAYKADVVFFGIDCLKDGSAEWLFEGEEPQLLSSCLRGLIVADTGNLLVVNDWSNVEGRMLAWLAGEEWKLRAFRDFDAGHGHDLYKTTYGRTFGIAPEDVTKAQRQMGKVLELAMGYGGGAGAFVTFSHGYGMDLDKLADDIYGAVDGEFVRQAADSWDWFVQNKATCGLSKRTFIAVDAVKRAWRAANPHIVALWAEAGDACVNAIKEKGREFRFGAEKRMWAKASDRFLRVALPSGRCLCYANPQLGDMKGSFTYLGVNQRTRKWERLESYSGKVVENVTQASACDLLGAALVRLEKEGIAPVMHVHDEIICEVPAAKAEASFKRMVEIMTTPPEEYSGIPLAVDGFIGDRYKKKD